MSSTCKEWTEFGRNRLNRLDNCVRTTCSNRKRGKISRSHCNTQEKRGNNAMAGVRTNNPGGHAATQTIYDADLKRLARELGQLIGKCLAEQPLKNTTKAVTRRRAVDSESDGNTITHTGQTGDSDVEHSKHRHEDRAIRSETSLYVGPSPLTRSASQNGR